MGQSRPLRPSLDEQDWGRAYPAAAQHDFDPPSSSLVRSWRLTPIGTTLDLLIAEGSCL